MNVKKELPIIVIVLLPFIYLAYVWNDLPQTVPLHWNWKGEIDRYGDKIELWVIPFLLPFLIYIILTLVPLIDPKNKIQKMGNKLHAVKLLLTTCMSVLALFIIYVVKNQELASPNFAIIIIGVTFIILGNYLKTIQPNYFIGIRTPWALENESVWKKTHKLGGKMWFIGGITIVLASLVLSNQQNLIFFLAVLIIISITPIIYSYVVFKRNNDLS